MEGVADLLEMVQSQMTDVPDNRTSQMAEFKRIEEVYKIIVFFEYFKNLEYTVYICQILYFNSKFSSIKKNIVIL